MLLRRHRKAKEIVKPVKTEVENTAETVENTAENTEVKRTRKKK